VQLADSELDGDSAADGDDVGKRRRQTMPSSEPVLERNRSPPNVQGRKAASEQLQYETSRTAPTNQLSTAGTRIRYATVASNQGTFGCGIA
jgi:hypothetical protein